MPSDHNTSCVASEDTRSNNKIINSQLPVSNVMSSGAQTIYALSILRAHNNIIVIVTRHVP